MIRVLVESPLFGPVADNRPARLLRVGGCVLAAAEGCFLTHSLAAAGTAGQILEKARYGVPLLGTLLLVHVLAIGAASARRSAVPPRTLAIGGASGAAAGLAFLAVPLLAPPLPASVGWALPAPLCAGAAALLLSRLRPGPRRTGAVAVLVAVMVSALLLAASAQGMLQFLAHWVPDTSPPDVPEADRLANNRLGAEDPYLLLLGLGASAAAALACLTGAARWRRGAPRAGSAALVESPPPAAF